MRPQMLMHTVTAHRGCSDTGGESALKVDQGRKFSATPGKWTWVSTVPGFPVQQSTCWAILLPLSGILSCFVCAWDAGGPLPEREKFFLINWTVNVQQQEIIPVESGKRCSTLKPLRYQNELWAGSIWQNWLSQTPSNWTDQVNVTCHSFWQEFRSIILPPSICISHTKPLVLYLFHARSNRTMLKPQWTGINFKLQFVSIILVILKQGQGHQSMDKVDFS